ncbi:MAG: UvrD-helicase domain-containing protein [Halanaerobiales bacterium]
MSDLNYTEEQQTAINDLDNDIVLGAGAGSGKTMVLVSRFINLLREKRADVDEIMALTFTKKAAAEMQERIREEITKQEENAVDFVEKKYWYKQKLDLNSAIISTFHSFAANTLRQYPVISEVDPEFQVLEENEAAELLDQTIDEIIEEGLNEEKENVMNLVRTYSLYTLSDKLKSIYFEMKKDNLNVEDLIKATFQTLQRDKIIREQVKQDLINEIEGLIKVFDEEGATGKSKDKMQNLQAEWPTLQEKISKLERIDQGIFEDIIAIKDIVKGRLSNNLNDRAKEIKDLLKSKEFKSYFIIERAEKIIRPLTEVIQQIETLYSAKKENNSYLDFYDLQDNLIKILKANPELKQNLNDQYKYIMVDEFQDNNPVQEKIIEQLGKNDEINVFLVGDPKQSIYRFRGADVRVFNRQKEKIESRDGEIYKLSKNFRSRPSILRFVNFLFEKILSNDPGIPYQRLSSFRTEETDDIELNLIAETEFEENLNSEDLRELEAEFLAERVSQVIDNEEHLIEEDGKKRKIKPGDISYLFQALSNVELYENALLKRNISVNVVNGRGFYEQQVVLDIINLIKVVENNYRDFELTGLLRSPFCGLNDNEIYKINKRKKQHLWDFLSQNKLAGFPEAKKKNIEKFVELINTARSLNDVKNPYLLLKDLIEKSNYKESIKANSNYKQKWANLDKVLTQIKNIYLEQNCSLKEVLEFYLRNKESETREGQAEVKSKDGVVQLMSIHQAKGLEFPVVIIPDIQRRLIHHNSMPDVLIDDEDGLGLKISTEDESLGTPLYNTLKEKEKGLELYEKIRLLYVAMTRAEDKLILSGYTKNNRKLSFEDSKNWLDWLACYLNKEEFIESETIKREYYNEEIFLNINIIKDDKFKTDDFSKEQTETKSPNIDIEDWDNTEQWERIGPQIKKVNKKNKVHKEEISVTGLLEYEKCPRLYYLRQLKRVPELGPLGIVNNKNIKAESKIDPLIKGTIIHRLYELSGLEKNPEQYFDQVVNEMNIYDLGEPVRDELIEIISKYQAREREYLKKQAQLEKIYREKQFNLNYKNFHLRGTIDNIYIYRNGELEIVDFKTNNIDKSEVESKSEEYRLQLEAYALAASKLFQKNALKYRIEYLIPEVNYSKFLNQESLKMIETKVCYLGEKIAAGNKKEEFPINSSEEGCKYCIYGKLCE